MPENDDLASDATSDVPGADALAERRRLHHEKVHKSREVVRDAIQSFERETRELEDIRQRTANPYAQPELTDEARRAELAHLDPEQALKKIHTDFQARRAWQEIDDERAREHARLANLVRMARSHGMKSLAGQSPYDHFLVAVVLNRLDWVAAIGIPLAVGLQEIRSRGHLRDTFTLWQQFG